MTRLGGLLLGLLLVGGAVAAEPPAEPLKVPPRPLEELKFPPGTIIVVRDSKEGLGKIDAVVLSPEEYRRQVEQIEQLQKQLNKDRPPPPGTCRISGKVEQRGQNDVVRIRAVFEFVSPAERTTYFLGFRRAAAVAATLDGGALPQLRDNADGYLVRIESAGRHMLTLDLELPLLARGTKGGERGLVLNLPGSPITLIDDLELPAGVEAVRVRPLVPTGPLALPTTVRTLRTSDLRKPAGDLPALALGPIEGVELFWDVPTPQRPTEPVLTAEGDIRVQIGETFVQTTAGLLLRSLRGRIAEWRLQTPPDAEVTLPGAADSGITITPVNNDRSQWLLKARDTGVESLTVEVQSRQTRTGQPVPVGPFNLIGAFRQQGTIRLSAPNHLRLRVTQPRNDIGRRELPADTAIPAEARAEFVQAMYRYGQVSAASPGSALMFVDAEPIGGELRTQVTHQLSWSEVGWRLVTDIKATPIRMDLEFIEVEIPAVLHPTIEVGPRELVEKFERVDAASNRWRVMLAHPRRGETTIRLEAHYPRPADAPRGVAGRDSASLTLPRVQQTIDRDGQVIVTIPEGRELRGSVREWERDRPSESLRPLEERPGKTPSLMLTTNRSPAVLELSWGPLGSAPPESTADIVMDAAQWTVRHRLKLPPSAMARSIVLRAVGSPPSLVRVLQGGTLTATSEREWLLNVPASAEDSTVVLAYARTVESEFQAGDQVSPPLLWPGSGEGSMRVHVWTERTSVVPRLRAGAWEQLAAAPVPGYSSLPVLTLVAAGTPAPLDFDLIEAAALAPVSVVAEKVLIQVVTSESGPHHYLARFLLHRVAATNIDLELPATVMAVGNLELFVAGRRLDQVVVINPDGTPASPNTGRIIRVPLPAGEPRVELAIRYFLSDRETSIGPLGRWRMTLAPPRPRGPVFVGAVRWHVVLPGDDVILPGDERVVLEQSWGLRRGLPALVPSRSAKDLDEWFRADLDPAAESSSYVAGGVVLRQAGLAPVRLVPVPRVGWYLACSLAVLILGGLLMLLWRWRWLFWPVLTLLLAALATAALWWKPLALSVIAGAPPGAIVLTLLLVITVWQVRRYHRRIVFLPGFSRTRPPTIATPPGSSQRRLQPSTVDAPPDL